MDVDPLAIAAADPIPGCLAYLRSNPIMLEQVGGPEHITGYLKDVSPCIVLSTSNGGAPSDNFTFNFPEILVECYGSPDGTPGKAELRRLLVIACVILTNMPDEGVTSNRAAIVGARMTSPYMFMPDLRSAQTPGGSYGGGAISWRATIGLTVHSVTGGR